mmetsp:Transcript_19507/g.47638  ORF Transcript_19507/g.47638 Transcript_19507/m.47638 type:complete len:323 (-) Transcript_19507:150-1118(-)
MRPRCRRQPRRLFFLLSSLLLPLLLLNHQRGREVTPVLRGRDTEVQPRRLSFNPGYPDQARTKQLRFGGHIVYHVVSESERPKTDVIPGEYEGGGTLWSCTKDLIGYFEENNKQNIFREKAVLELGCGYAIGSIYALACAAKQVTLQDFNSNILEYVAVPNLLLNHKGLLQQTGNSYPSDKVRLFCGPWGKELVKVVLDEEPRKKRKTQRERKNGGMKDKDGAKFDIILASDTVYQPESTESFLLTVKGLLRKNGECFLATQRYYFGLGGGIFKLREIARRVGGLTLDEFPLSCPHGGVKKAIVRITHTPFAREGTSSACVS